VSSCSFAGVLTLLKVSYADDGYVHDASYKLEPDMDPTAGSGVNVDIDDEGGAAITQEDCWNVIDAFFDEKGLVRQQLESFNEFVDNTMQELVDENSTLTMDQYAQHSGVYGDQTVSRTIGDCR
jgi:DNA-directed RNA polymerase II subunit RPB2